MTLQEFLQKHQIVTVNGRVSYLPEKWAFISEKQAVDYIATTKVSTIVNSTGETFEYNGKKWVKQGKGRGKKKSRVSAYDLLTEADKAKK